MFDVLAAGQSFSARASSHQPSLAPSKALPDIGLDGQPPQPVAGFVWHRLLMDTGFRMRVKDVLAQERCSINGLLRRVSKQVANNLRARFVWWLRHARTVQFASRCAHSPLRAAEGLGGWRMVQSVGPCVAPSVPCDGSHAHRRHGS